VANEIGSTLFRGCGWGLEPRRGRGWPPSRMNQYSPIYARMFVPPQTDFRRGAAPVSFGPVPFYPAPRHEENHFTSYDELEPEDYQPIPPVPPVEYPPLPVEYPSVAYPPISHYQECYAQETNIESSPISDCPPVWSPQATQEPGESESEDGECHRCTALHAEIDHLQRQLHFIQILQQVDWEKVRALVQLLATSGNEMQLTVLEAGKLLERLSNTLP
jgi:hypothetical protein